ncbi:primase-helicase zinc-binding domain-containing protein [Sphingobacterium siyangense]|uniref:primase-helicase zinc-binding domain-containing protein n=1 Tax=Sphingobacterium siyangense TaxID=459529 RepID=UPI001964B6D7|nr:primase-helicase zinc-binding domain-containing protein [Sphingobacterium siyangense]QRY60515.1 hypothetical protein JVX97_14115 [Sphingobacterium siyangense]
MSNTNNNTGLECPNCKGKIKFSFEDLLYKNYIICPFCALKMEMTVPESMKKHLIEIMEAEKKIKSLKNTIDDASLQKQLQELDLLDISKYMVPSKNQ